MPQNSPSTEQTVDTPEPTNPKKATKPDVSKVAAPKPGRTQDVNEVRLRGTLATAPELRTFESGSSLARLLVTVRSSGERARTDVIPVTVWDPGKRVMGARRGDRIGVEGAVQRRFWTTPDGRNSRVEVVGRRVTVRRSAASG